MTYLIPCTVALARANNTAKQSDIFLEEAQTALTAYLTDPDYGHCRAEIRHAIREVEGAKFQRVRRRA